MDRLVSTTKENIRRNKIKGDRMLETLFWLALGAFIGWNFPQPEFAKNIQAKIIAMVRKD